MFKVKDGNTLKSFKETYIHHNFCSFSSISRKMYFDMVAESWDQRFNTPKLVSFLEELVPKFGLKPGFKVLDVGTGTGLLIPFLLKAIGPSGKVIAIDFSERMVQICKAKYSHLKNVTIELCDVEEKNLQPEFFDAVTCFGVVPHLEKKEKALRNINRSLKHGGIFIISHALSSKEIKAHHNKAPLFISNDLLPEETEMRCLLNHAGFTEIYIKDEPGCYLCVSRKR
ncbi:MAG: class I SAM-dependent methyltransferase [Candidatus Jordarchaeaceae archaeon]